MSERQPSLPGPRLLEIIRRCLRDQPRCLAIVYLAFGLFWIYGTDYLMEHFVDFPLWAKISLYKGILFVLVTALLFYRILASRLKAHQQAVAKHYEHVVRFANDIFILAEVEPPHRLIEANDRAFAVYGYSRNELIGLSAEKLRVPALRAQSGADITAFFNQAPGPLYETVHQRKDGTTFPVEITGHEVDIGGRRYYQAMIRDISERKRHETMLALSRERLRMLIDSLPDPAWMKDADGRYTAANQALADFLGVDPKDIIGKVSADFFPADRAKAFAANEQRVIEQKQRRSEIASFDIGGERRWYDTVVVPVAEERDARHGTAGIARDITENKHLQDEREAFQRRLEQMLVETIHAMALTVEKRDPYTAGHQGKVADLAVAIGREMGLSDNMTQGLRLGGMIHDIGKIYIPAEILSRPGRLSEEEMSLIRTHPQVGHDIVKGVNFIWSIKEIVLQHHERLDGSGYPHGLKGDEIALEARIIAVADVVEAISSHRPYRAALGIEHGLEEIRRGSGTRYDSAVVDACLKLFAEKRYHLDLN